MAVSPDEAGTLTVTEGDTPTVTQRTLHANESTANTTAKRQPTAAAGAAEAKVGTKSETEHENTSPKGHGKDVSLSSSEDEDEAMRASAKRCVEPGCVYMANTEEELLDHQEQGTCSTSLKLCSYFVLQTAVHTVHRI